MLHGLASLLAGCATLPPDILACQELDIDRGFCIKTVSGAAGYVDDKLKIYDEGTDTEYTWFDMRPFMIMIPAFDYIKLKTYIIEQCKVTQKCDEKIASWERTLNNIDQVIKEKQGLPKGQTK